MDKNPLKLSLSPVQKKAKCTDCIIHNSIYDSEKKLRVFTDKAIEKVIHVYFFIRNSFIRNLVVASSKIKKLLLLQNISTFGIRNFFYFLQKNN